MGPSRGTFDWQIPYMVHVHTCWKFLICVLHVLTPLICVALYHIQYLHMRAHTHTHTRTHAHTCSVARPPMSPTVYAMTTCTRLPTLPPLPLAREMSQSLRRPATTLPARPPSSKPLTRRAAFVHHITSHHITSFRIALHCTGYCIVLHCIVPVLYHEEPGDPVRAASEGATPILYMACVLLLSLWCCCW